MPTYDYECGDCGHGFEIIEKMNSRKKICCPNCGSKETKRIITGGAGFILRGPGFYNTEYKHKNNSTKEDTSESESDK